MRFLEALCETVVRALGLSAMTKWGKSSTDQQPLGGYVEVDAGLPPGPKFSLPNSKITCDYSAMRGYKYAGGSQTGPVGSWLVPPDDKHPAYNIFTDYENEAPQGIIRHVSLTYVVAANLRPIC